MYLVIRCLINSYIIMKDICKKNFIKEIAFLLFKTEISDFEVDSFIDYPDFFNLLCANDSKDFGLSATLKTSNKLFRFAQLVNSIWATDSIYNKITIANSEQNFKDLVKEVFKNNDIDVIRTLFRCKKGFELSYVIASVVADQAINFEIVEEIKSLTARSQICGLKRTIDEIKKIKFEEDEEVSRLTKRPKTIDNRNYNLIKSYHSFKPIDFKQEESKQIDINFQISPQASPNNFNFNTNVSEPVLDINISPLENKLLLDQ